MEVNGEQLTPSKENCLKFFGPPSFTIQIPDGEVCIWRNSVFGARLRSARRWDFIMTFDRDGNFVPTDLTADYGFCHRCGCDLRGFEGNVCPECGKPTEDE